MEEEAVDVLLVTFEEGDAEQLIGLQQFDVTLKNGNKQLQFVKETSVDDVTAVALAVNLTMA